ncbi:hypothetical protein [Endozoicomonas sp. ALD040]|uniref:hypothetical protein n=1 Tax=Endozoicomonas sp. ALD040 TaxID=3403079 RepID=UPI003BB12039
MAALDELIKKTDRNKQNEMLKRTFSADADLVVIDGREYETLLFLINRTIKGKKDFSDETSLNLLKDEAWRNDVLKVTEWIHTHNLKCPYSKADGCIFYYEEALHLRKTKILGYAKDSKQINKCQFMVTEFIYNGTVTSLVEQFASYKNGENNLVDKLVEAGFPKERIPLFKEKCSAALEVRLPDFVHKHCKQVRFLQKNGEYIAVTPVVKTETQQIVHNLAKESGIYGSTVFHYRPSSIGNLISATGGRVRCLSYHPSLGDKDKTTDYLFQQWNHKHHLLNERALFSKQTFRLLFGVLEHKANFSTYQAGKASKKQYNQRMRNLAEDLFSEITFLKTKEITDYPELHSSFAGSLEREVIEESFELEEAVNHFTRQIHELLEKSEHHQILAYEPVLIDEVGNAVRSYLLKQSQPKGTPGHFVYIHFERLQAYGAKLQSNSYLIGIPSLTAFSGFVHVFLLRLLRVKKTDASFAIALRRFDRRSGHPLAKKICKKNVVKNDTVIDSQHGDIEFDLIIRLDQPASNLDFSERNLYRCLPNRLAGGILSSPIAGVYQKPSLVRRCNTYEDEIELLRGFSKLSSCARFISDIDPEISYNSMQKLAEVLKDTYGVFPVNKGFKFLGAPQFRRGSIADTHAYAEPMTGLVKLVSPASVVINPEIRNRSFWRMQVSKYSVELTSGESNDRTV